LKRVIQGFWAAGLVLSAWHLCYLAAYDFKPLFWVFLFVLLGLYSAPFFVLMKIKITENSLAKKYFIWTLVAAIMAVSLLLPIRRFLPGYRPAALESIAYITLPILELVLIAVFLAVSSFWPKKVDHGADSIK
jgi:hypothetical protein